MKQIAYLLGGGYTKEKVIQYNAVKTQKKQIPSLFKKDIPAHTSKTR